MGYTADGPTLGELILHAQQAAKELGFDHPSVSVETLGLHGCVATVSNVVPTAAGRGRTPNEAVSNLIEALVERLRVKG